MASFAQCPAMSAKAVFVAVATGATASVVVSVTGVVSSATSVAKATENELSTKLKARIKANPFLLFIIIPPFICCFTFCGYLLPFCSLVCKCAFTSLQTAD
jgi:hypothetical protein